MNEFVETFSPFNRTRSPATVLTKVSTALMTPPILCASPFYMFTFVRMRSTHAADKKRSTSNVPIDYCDTPHNKYHNNFCSMAMLWHSNAFHSSENQSYWSLVVVTWYSLTFNKHAHAHKNIGLQKQNRRKMKIKENRVKKNRENVYQHTTNKPANQPTLNEHTKKDTHTRTNNEERK